MFNARIWLFLGRPNRLLKTTMVIGTKLTMVLILPLVCFALTAQLSQAGVRIASWNINNLHHREGEPLRSRAPIRFEADYAILRDYAHRLHADVIAFQEVNGPDAARMVFPDDEYIVFISGRYAKDLSSGQQSDRIYTGFAVRRKAFDYVDTSDYSSLSVGHGATGRPTRWGVEMNLQRNGRKLRLLNVHLKSGCFRGRLDSPSSPNCLTLAKQRRPLEDWIDRYANDGPLVVLGDFNRALDIFGDRDHLWQEIDDGDPPGLKLWRLPYERESKCWKGTGNHHENPVDFFVFNQSAWGLVTANSFREFNYDEAHRDTDARTPSDHCPIAVELEF